MSDVILSDKTLSSAMSSPCRLKKSALLNGSSTFLKPNHSCPVTLSCFFLTWTTERYVAIPNRKKTANCSYFQRWDSNLRAVRYAVTNAVICYGASIYRPGLSPAVISARRGE